MNTNNDVKKAIKKYLEREKEYRDYLNQFVSSAVGDEILKPPKRALNNEEFAKLEKMYEEVERLHTEMTKKLREMK